MAYHQLHRNLSIIEEEDLEVTIVALEDDHASLDEEVEDAMNELDRMKSEFAEVTRQLQEKSDQLAQLKVKNADLELKLEQSEGIQLELKKSLQDKEERIYCLRRETEYIEELKTRMDILRLQTQNLQEQLEVNGNARCDLEDSLEEISQDDEELKRFQKRCQELEDILTRRSSRILELEGVNAELNRKLEYFMEAELELKTDLLKVQEEDEFLVKENKTLREEVAILQKNEAELKTALQTRTDQYEESIVEIGNLGKAAERLRRALEELVRSNRDLESLELKMSSKLEGKEEVCSLAGCVGKLRAELDDLEKVKDEVLKNDVEGKKQVMGQLELENRDLKGQVQMLQLKMDQVDKLSQEKVDLTKDNEDLRVHIQKLQLRAGEVDKLRQEKLGLTQENQGLREKLQTELLRMDVVHMQELTEVREDLKSVYDEAQKVKQELLTENKDLQGQLQKLVSRVEEFDRLSQNELQLAEENEDLKEQVQKLLTRLEEVGELRQGKLQLAEENGDLKGQVQKLLSRLDEVGKLKQEKLQLADENKDLKGQVRKLLSKLDEVDKPSQEKSKENEDLKVQVQNLLLRSKENLELVEENEDLKRQVQELLARSIKEEKPASTSETRFSFGQKEQTFTMGGDFPRTMTRRSKFRGSMPGHLENWFWTKQEIFAEKRAKSF